MNESSCQILVLRSAGMLSSDIFINIILKPTPKLFLVYSGASTNATYKKSFIPSTPLAQRLIGNYAGNKAKGRISKRVFQENKAREIFRKTNISYPATHTYVFVSGGKKCSFFGTVGVLFLETPVLRSALLPHYRRLISFLCIIQPSYP